jgi:hypothetical protein
VNDHEKANFPPPDYPPTTGGKNMKNILLLVLPLLFIAAATADVGCDITVHDYNLTSGAVGGTAYTGQNGNGTLPLTVNYTVACYPNTTNYTSTVTVGGTAAGSDATLVNNSINYFTLNTSFADASYVINVTTTNGTYTNASSDTTLIIDTLAPTTSITTPANVTYQRGGSASLTFTYTEANPNTCWYDIGNGNSTIGYVNGTTVAFARGVYNVKLWCNDYSGHTSTMQNVWFTIPLVNYGAGDLPGMVIDVLGGLLAPLASAAPPIVWVIIAGIVVAGIVGLLWHVKRWE